MLITHLHLRQNIKNNLMLYLQDNAKAHMGCNDSSFLLYLPLHMHVCVNEDQELKALFYMDLCIILYKNQVIISTTLSKGLHGFVNLSKGMCQNRT
jgi:hypothetical protein